MTTIVQQAYSQHGFGPFTSSGMIHWSVVWLVGWLSIQHGPNGFFCWDPWASMSPAGDLRLLRWTVRQLFFGDAMEKLLWHWMCFMFCIYSPEFEIMPFSNQGHSKMVGWEVVVGQKCWHLPCESYWIAALSSTQACNSKLQPHLGQQCWFTGSTMGWQ